MSFELSDGFTADVRDAIQSGLPTTFSYEVELRRGSRRSFDRTVASVTITAIVRFDNLTRRYQMSRTVDGRVEDARPTEDQDAVRALDDALRARAAVDDRRRSRPTASTTSASARARGRTTPGSSGRGIAAACSGSAKFTFIP